MILQDAEGNDKIKLYTDAEGKTKGEALVVYLQEGSIELAIKLLDETEFRQGSGLLMKVQKAEFKEASTSNGDATTKKKKQKKDPEKDKQQKKAEKLKQKLTDWSSDEDNTAAKGPKTRTVILTRMFTLAELEKDPTLLLELKEDVREECEETIGKVSNVVLYDVSSVLSVAVHESDLKVSWNRKVL